MSAIHSPIRLPQYDLVEAVLLLGIITSPVTNLSVSVSPPASPELKNNNKRTCPPAPKKAPEGPPTKISRCSFTGSSGSLPPRFSEPRCRNCDNIIAHCTPCRRCN